MHRLPGARAEVDVWDDADLQFDAASTDGTSFSLTAVPPNQPDGVEGVLVGQPDADRVVRLDNRPGVGLIDGVSWYDAGRSELGASVLALSAADGSGGFDLWVGAPSARGTRGLTLVYRRADLDGDVAIADAENTLAGGTPSDRVGGELVRCADLTGDGVPEVAILVPAFVQPPDWPATRAAIPSLAGAVMIVPSEAIAAPAASVDVWDVATVYWGEERGEGVGTAVVCDRDVDGDGVVDLVAGAPWRLGGAGRVYVIGASPLPESARLVDLPGVTVLNGTAGSRDRLGESLAALTAADGVLMAIGRPGADNGRGQVDLYFGPSLRAPAPVPLAGFVGDPARTAPDHFGRRLTAGDLDGDLLGDLVIGTPDLRGDGRDAFDLGEAVVWLGANRAEWAAETIAPEADLIVAGTRPFQRVGQDVLAADTDGDTRSELWFPTRTAGLGDH